MPSMLTTTATMLFSIRVPHQVPSLEIQRSSASPCGLFFGGATLVTLSTARNHGATPSSLIHWNAKIPSSLGGGNSNGVVTMTSLAHYCSEKWFRTCHLEQMVAILKQRISAADIQQVDIAEPDFFWSLVRYYRDSPDNEKCSISRCLESGMLSCIAFPVWKPLRLS